MFPSGAAVCPSPYSSVAILLTLFPVLCPPSQDLAIPQQKQNRILKHNVCEKKRKTEWDVIQHDCPEMQNTQNNTMYWSGTPIYVDIGVKGESNDCINECINKPVSGVARKKGARMGKEATERKTWTNYLVCHKLKDLIAYTSLTKVEQKPCFT